MKKMMIILIGLMVGVWGVFSGEFCELTYADDSSEENQALPEIFIKAVSPGYKIDGVNNVGEMIEIGRTKSSDVPISLAGYYFSYTNSSGNASELIRFPEHTKMAGESIILRLASSPESELANLVYKKTLGMEGGLTLIKDEEVVDAVCWTGKEGCEKKFSSKEPTILVRERQEGAFRHVPKYEPIFDVSAYIEEVSPDGGASDSGALGDGSSNGVGEDSDEGYGAVAPRCVGVVFSELLSYHAESKLEQFVEFYNTGTETIMLDGCLVRYKNKDYALSGQVESEGYLAWWLRDFNVTKNPTNSGKLELVDANSVVLDTLEYPNGQRKGTSWAFIGYDDGGKEIWRTTYAVTPGEANVYQEFKSCEEGKVINEETGNCVKITEVSAKTCPEGQYLNPATGRCRKIVVEEDKECAEGYEINPDTGRCRKIKKNNGAEYELSSEKYEESSTFVAIFAVVLIVVFSLGYVIWEYRREIAKFWRKFYQKFKK